jgi:hypothetical protein
MKKIPYRTKKVNEFYTGFVSLFSFSPTTPPVGLAQPGLNSFGILTSFNVKL